MRINQQQKGVVVDRLTFKVEDITRIAAQQHSNASNKWRRPVFLAHLGATGVEPHHIAGFRSANPAALKEFWAPKYRMRLAERNQLSREL